MRVVQQAGRKGSLKWLQLAVNRRPELIEHPSIGYVDWLSPLEADDYAEYRDAAFLHLVGLGHLAPALAEFWPARGPQWDALGRSGTNIVLVEAKAHIAELLSPPCAAGPASLARIEAAFERVRADLGISAGALWTQSFYQLANRLAHLHFLISKGIEAHLLLFGFVGDGEVGGPHDPAEWRAAYQVANYAMRLPAES